MNQFDQSLKASKRKHLGLQLTIGGILLLLVVLFSLWMFLGRGYTVQVSPERAANSATFNVSGGFAWFSGNKLYSLSKQTAFTVGANTYISADLTVTDSSEPNVFVELKPQPGQLTANFAPQYTAGQDDAVWSINNEMITVGGELSTTLQPGEHQLSVDSPYFEVLEQTFAIDNAQQLQQTLDLTPVTGAFSFDSNPAGATVTINGEVAGQTPLTLNKTGGEYQVAITLDGYQLIEEPIALTNQKRQIDRNYQLKALQSQLSFNITPPGGDLLLDGKKLTTFNNIPVDANKAHHVIYQKPGFYEFKQSLTLPAGQSQTLDIALKRENGKVVFESTPLSQVTLDGRILGQTPIELTLPAKKHTVAFKKDGYRGIIRDITPSAKATTSVKVELLTEFQARRKAGKASVAQQLGIELLPFGPGEVLMGSKANDKGRRRNEFLKQVTLSKGILASRHEITEGQYNNFKGQKGGSKLPISNVTWHDAVRFCNWLSEQEGLPPFYRLAGGRYIGINKDATGYRLPSEAEWEYLARKAKRAVETRFVWGNVENLVIGQVNVADSNAKDNTTFVFKKYDDKYKAKSPVGTFKADSAGLFDMAGNVSEWVHDFYTNMPPKKGQTFVDPFGPAQGSGHVIKGANYHTGRWSELRSAYREVQTDAAPTLGFRIVRYQNP